MPSYPETFLWSGVSSGVKKSGRPDLALAYSSYPATTAGVFTTNSFAAAPVLEARERLEDRDEFRGVIVNSGVANAATGERGREDNRALIDAAADVLGIPPGEVLSASTGHIGDRLPLDDIESSLPGAVDELGENTERFSRAILTTDTATKVESRDLDAPDACLHGVAKGAGMIRPDMATMLAFLFLDHPVDPTWWQDCLEEACDSSFNRITVDGEMSTNDTVLALAARVPDRSPIDASHPGAPAVRDAVSSLCRSLSRSIVADGEGATRTIEVRVHGAERDADARRVAESIANSNLVKTAFHGGDPNWGRIYSSIGAAGLNLRPDRTRIRIDGYTVYDPGKDRVGVPEDLRESMREPGDHRIRIDLDEGNGSDSVLTCDLSPGYVSINADYTT